MCGDGGGFARADQQEDVDVFVEFGQVVDVADLGGRGEDRVVGGDVVGVGAEDGEEEEKGDEGVECGVEMEEAVEEGVPALGCRRVLSCVGRWG